MELVATLHYSANVELALTELERHGIPRSGLMAVPLQRTTPFVTIHAVGTGGGTNWDYSFVFGTIGMLLGCIYGFVLPGGPILWALGGLAGFFLVGMITSAILRNRKIKRLSSTPEVVVWLRCEEGDAERLKTLLIDHGATGIGEIVGGA